MPRLVLPEYTVLRDTREKEGHGWIFKPQKEDHRPPRCIGTTIKTLKIGDYTIAGKGEQLLAIERKYNFSELWVNYSKRQLFEEECTRMKDLKYKFVLIESSLTSDVLSLSPPQFTKGVPGHALISWLINLSISFGINIIPVGEGCGKKYAQLIFENVIRAEKDLWITS